MTPSVPGLAGLAESLALEVESYNIRVMTIFLGQVAKECGKIIITIITRKIRIKCFSPQKKAAKIVE